jgi:hypothetical protein
MSAIDKHVIYRLAAETRLNPETVERWWVGECSRSTDEKVCSVLGRLDLLHLLPQRVVVTPATLRALQIDASDVFALAEMK